MSDELTERVRVDHHRFDDSVTRPGADGAEMGADRSMGTGWLQGDEVAVDGSAPRFRLDVGLTAAARGR